MKETFSKGRKFHRVDFDGRVNIKFNGDHYAHCRVKDLSLTGLFVEGDFPKKQVANCFFSIFRETEDKRPLLKASGRVVRTNDNGVGLKFTSMAFNDYMSLLSALINNAEQPIIILHEFPTSCPFEVDGQ